MRCFCVFVLMTRGAHAVVSMSAALPGECIKPEYDGPCEGPPCGPEPPKLTEPEIFEKDKGRYETIFKAMPDEWAQLKNIYKIQMDGAVLQVALPFDHGKPTEAQGSEIESYTTSVKLFNDEGVYDSIFDILLGGYKGAFYYTELLRLLAKFFQTIEATKIKLHAFVAVKADENAVELGGRRQLMVKNMLAIAKGPGGITWAKGIVEMGPTIATGSEGRKAVDMEVACDLGIQNIWKAGTYFEKEAEYNKAHQEWEICKAKEEERAKQLAEFAQKEKEYQECLEKKKTPPPPPTPAACPDEPVVADDVNPDNYVCCMRMNQASDRVDLCFAYKKADTKSTCHSFDYHAYRYRPVDKIGTNVGAEGETQARCKVLQATYSGGKTKLCDWHGGDKVAHTHPGPFYPSTDMFKPTVHIPPPPAKAQKATTFGLWKESEHKFK